MAVESRPVNQNSELKKAKMSCAAGRNCRIKKVVLKVSGFSFDLYLFDMKLCKTFK